MTMAEPHYLIIIDHLIVHLKSFKSILMRFTITLFFTILCMSLQAQIDTIHVYDGFDMTYLQRDDTVLISEWKFARLVDVMRSANKEIEFWNAQTYYAAVARDACDSSLVEMERMAGVWKERSIMYRDMYTHTVDDAHKLHGIVLDCMIVAKEERRNGRMQGAVWGAVGGLVVGIITTAIILK